MSYSMSYSMSSSSSSSSGGVGSLEKLMAKLEKYKYNKIKKIFYCSRILNMPITTQVITKPIYKATKVTKNMFSYMLPWNWNKS